MNNEYKYVGEPFTDAIAGELILELCKGETLKKAVIMNRVYDEHHVKQGGTEYAGNRRELQLTFNQGLQKLKKRGLATNEGTGKTGYWKIMGMSSPDTPPDELPESCVYIYYYPAYRKLAQFEKEDKYPCKIGSTGRGADTRIKEQVTGMPEKATRELVIETDDPFGLEQMIHYYLKRMGVHIQEAPGDEWYLINSEIAKTVAETVEGFEKILADVL